MNRRGCICKLSCLRIPNDILPAYDIDDISCMTSHSDDARAHAGARARACVCVCVCGVAPTVLLSTLLYGCESWVMYRRSVRRLDEFHMRCLCKIAGIKRQDREPNTELLRLCDISGIEAFLLAYWQHNFAGLDMSSAWRTTGYPPNRSSSDSCRHVNAHSVVLLGVTRTQSRPT